jgi:hypothetical protein
MIGNFYREGRAFCRQAIPVNDHDFNSFAEGMAVPHGIYDVAKNICRPSTGMNGDTAEFVSENIDYNWNMSIKKDYPNAKKMLILCDGGGSNSSSHYVVKEQFKLLSEKLQMEIVVAHYPPYCSKWNPIEHRAFSFISKKWQGAVFGWCHVFIDITIGNLNASSIFQFCFIIPAHNAGVRGVKVLSGFLLSVV